MLFVIAGRFGPNTEAEREKIHADFNEHLMQGSPAVRFGGPLYDAAGRRSGVLLVVEAEDRGAAERFYQASPYAKAGLYDRHDIDELRPETGGLR